MSPRTSRRTTDPGARLGVYKRLSDVPKRYRLESHESAYADRDPWSDFQAGRFETIAKSKDTRDEYRLVGRRWGEHMADIGRHHALADPHQVESFFSDLLEKSSVGNGFKYWNRIEAFYSWMLWHTGHEHVYQPVIMAADQFPDGASGAIWDRKVGRAKEVRP